MAHLIRRWMMIAGIIACAFGPGATAYQDSGASSDIPLTDPDVEAALEALRNEEITKGLSILKSLAEQGNPIALYHMGETARLGIGREPSPSVSVMFFRMSAQMGYEVAAMKLANILYFDGEGTKAELDEAMSIWKEYALKGNREAQFLLGMIYWSGEHSGIQDPVRGYGLVWRAAEAGYNDAIQAELTMRAQLNGDARTVGEEYGRKFEEIGIDDSEPLRLDLLVEGYVSGTADTSLEPEEIEPPENWQAVWRLEVGFAMDEEDALVLMRRIQAEEVETVKDLAGAVIPAPNRDNAFRIVFGPVAGLNDAVRMCVDLKRAGHDCFAKPPGR